MNYDEFLKKLTQYQELYDKGLKKQANAHLRSFMVKFDKVNGELKDKIWLEFCLNLYDICDFAHKILKSRGNGELPYEINLRLHEYLVRNTQEGKMPHLRWFYELVHDEDALNKAYAHELCDEQTIMLVFSRHIYNLYWWSHHLPDSCLSDKSRIENEIAACEKMILRHDIDILQRREFEYYKKLYEIWFSYNITKDGNFEKFCNDRGLSFYKEKIYSYE
ncbi:hypothetical protein [Campylobacter sp.]|uniref:hypothetical protein n=1 Tax=Campylobacter sp. TaxID=205 RepID=UPI00270EE322|nr:hypothetical protein [Campylobacter sp.]